MTETRVYRARCLRPWIFPDPFASAPQNFKPQAARRAAAPPVCLPFCARGGRGSEAGQLINSRRDGAGARGAVRCGAPSCMLMHAPPRPVARSWRAPPRPDAFLGGIGVFVPGPGGGLCAPGASRESRVWALLAGDGHKTCHGLVRAGGVGAAGLEGPQRGVEGSPRLGWAEIRMGKSLLICGVGVRGKKSKINLLNSTLETLKI